MPCGLPWKGKLGKGDSFSFIPKDLGDTTFSVGRLTCPFSRFLSVKTELL